MVEHLLLKEFYYNDSVESKIIIEDLEANLAGAPIDAKNLEVPEVSAEENYDEDITARGKVNKINESRDEVEIDIEEEQNIESYKVTLNIDIENIVKIENIHNHHKGRWKKIY